MAPVVYFRPHSHSLSLLLCQKIYWEGLFKCFYNISEAQNLKCWLNLCICILKTWVYFDIDGPHLIVPRVKMGDALASYISNYKFQFKFSLRIENCKFQ